jgi:hypothetical protein
VPVLDYVRAVTYHAVPQFGTVEEKMVFCPASLARWLTFDNERTNDKLHYRNLHVPIGGTPTQQQQDLASRMIKDGLDVSWLKKFLVKTIMHEMTHSVAFSTPSQNKLGEQCILL